MAVEKLAAFRKQYPEYDDLDDFDLAGRLASKYPKEYGELPKEVTLASRKPGLATELTRGPVEIAGTLVGGAAAQPIAGAVGVLAGLGSFLKGALTKEETKPVEDAQQAMQRVQKAMMPELRTRSAKAVLGAISYPFEKIEEGTTAVGRGVESLTGIPYSEPAVAVALQAIPMLLGGRAGAKGMAKVGAKLEAKMISKLGTQYSEMIRDFTGELSIEQFKSNVFAKTIKKALPDKDVQSAMSLFHAADGDEALLLQRAMKLEAAGHTKAAALHHAATKLTPEQKRFRVEVQKHMDENWQKANNAGILEAYVENYLPQISTKPNQVLKSLYSQFVGSGLLSKNPSFAKKRVFDSYFDLIMAGRKPTNMSVGYLVQASDRAVAKSVATRNFLEKLMKAKGSDGRPLAYVEGFMEDIMKKNYLDVILGKAELEAQAHLIKPQGRPRDYWDYARPPENAAFRKWKWVEKDEQNRPYFMEGEIRLHPEIGKQVNNVFGQSKMRQNAVGRAVLSGVSNLKGTLFSLSGFHQATVAEHAAFHRVNPFRVPKLNMNDPLTVKLIKAGTIVADYSGENLFAEGLSAGGFIGKLPGIGPLATKYTDYLFKSYIPRLKMSMAKAAYGRNIERYRGKLNETQLLQLTSDQANAAFGELNYAALGRNKTLQDVMRAAFIAPDFFEARARFATQALAPLGREQFMAAVTVGTLVPYMGARIVNSLLNNGDPKWNKPFSVVVQGREYMSRSISGDIYHLATNPQHFAYVRLNPSTVKPMIEGLTSRDYLGRWKPFHQQVVDYFKAHIPIGTQYFARSPAQRRWWDAILSTVGVSAKGETTPALEVAKDIKRRTPFYTPEERREERQEVYEYIAAFDEARRAADPADARRQVIEKLKVEHAHQRLTKVDLKRIMESATHTELERLTKAMPLESYLVVWEQASPEERLSMLRGLVTKANNLEPIRREEMKEPLKLVFQEAKELIEWNKKREKGTAERLADVRAGR
jgi:hypothetical protein